MLRALEVAADRLDQTLPDDRLGLEGVATRVETSLPLAVHGVSGECDDGSFVATRTQRSGRLVPVEDWHLHVHQDDVEGSSLLLSRQRAVYSELSVLDDLELGDCLQNVPEKPPVGGGVLRDKDPAVELSSGCPGSSLRGTGPRRYGALRQLSERKGQTSVLFEGFRRADNGLGLNRSTQRSH